MSLERYQKDYDFQWNEIERYSDFFRHKASAAAMSVANGVLEDLMHGGEGRVALAGEEGCGKTVLFSYVCEELKRNGFTVLPVLLQSIACGTTPLDVMKVLVWQMEEAAGAEHTLDYDALGEPQNAKGINYVMGNNKRAMLALQSRFAELCTGYTTEQGKHLIIAVDALDLSFQGREWEETEYIPHLITKHIRVFATCQQECLSPEDVVRKSLAEFSGGTVRADWKKIQKKGMKAYLEIASSGTPAENVSNASDNSKRNVADACRLSEYLAVAFEGASAAELSILLNKNDNNDSDDLSGSSEGAASDISSDDMITSEAVQACLESNKECFLLRSDGHYVLSHHSIRAGILATCQEKKERIKAYAAYRKGEEYSTAADIRGYATALIHADEKDAFLTLLIRMTREENKGLVYPVAMEVFSYIFSEGNKWIEAVAKELVRSERSNEDKLSFVGFLAFQVWDCFVGIPKEALYKKRLAEILISIVDHCLEKKESAQGLFYRGMLYDFMGEILYWVNGPERPDQALSWFEKEAGVYEYMLREYGPGNMGLLRGAYDKLESIFVRQGDAAHLEKAEYYFQKEVLLSEKVSALTKTKDNFLLQSYSLEKLGDFLLEKGGKENLEQALVCAMRALSLRAVLSQGLKEPLESLPVSYAKISDVYYRLGGRENVKKALEFRELQIKLLKRILRNRRNEKLLQELSEAYNSLGGLYLEQGGPDNLEKAQKDFEESFAVMEELLTLNGTVGSLRNLYVGYYKLGDVYAYYGERDTMIAARHYFTKAKEICERLNAELKTQESKNDLMYIGRQLTALQSKLDNYGKKGRSLAEAAKEDGLAFESLREQYRKEGEALEEKGGKENLLLAAEKYKEELSLLQSEEAKSSTPEGRAEIAHAHLRIGNAHEQIGERNEYQNALRHFSTALQLFYQLDGENSGIRTQRALATAYIYRSNCCEKMGSREDTWLARDGYLQAKAIRERIYDKLHDEQSRKELAYCERQLERLEALIKENA